MVMELLHFRDRDAILRAARAAGSLEIKGNHVMLFPDYTIAAQQQRATFLKLKHKLRDLGLKYAPDLEQMIQDRKLAIAAVAALQSSSSASASDADEHPSSSAESSAHSDSTLTDSIVPVNEAPSTAHDAG